MYYSADEIMEEEKISAQADFSVNINRTSRIFYTVSLKGLFYVTITIYIGLYNRRSSIRPPLQMYFYVGLSMAGFLVSFDCFSFLFLDFLTYLI